MSKENVCLWTLLCNKWYGNVGIVKDLCAYFVAIRSDTVTHRDSKTCTASPHSGNNRRLIFLETRRPAKRFLYTIQELDYT